MYIDVQSEQSRRGRQQRKVCATLAAVDDRRRGPYDNAFWSHARGRSCFALDTTRPLPD